MRYGGVAISQSFFPGLDHAPPSVERIGTACDKDFSACASLIADSVEDDDVCNKTPRRPTAGSASSRVSSAGIQYDSEGEKCKRWLGRPRASLAVLGLFYAGVVGWVLLC